MVVMAHGLNSVLKRGPGIGGGGNKGDTGGSKTGIGSRRIFPPHFKLQVLDSYRNDADCKGNQRATARKYGIHRRQIQKWLQAESNLRNSVVGVGKGKSGEVELALRSAGLRQRDDPAAPDAYSQSGAIPPRVPAVSPDAYSESAWSPQQPTVALDFTTHSRTPPCDLSAPIDLSLKRPQGDPCAPVYVPPLPARHQQQEQPHCLARLPPPPAPPTSPLIQHMKADPDIWDLSTKPTKRKHEDDEPPTQRTTSTTPKPVKLFKPYLDDLHDTSSSSDDSHPSKASPPLCCGGTAPIYHSTPELLNNNIYEYTYTLHELQPTTSLPPSFYYQPLKAYSTFCHDGYDDAILQPTPLKQRQSYSLDFKLRAIECYYQDEMCRGNQRAVASKYNIHRRQVQKWLKQEEELRQRNESVKLMHTVR